MSDQDDLKPRPHIAKMTGYKGGRCTICNKGAERTKVFTGSDLWNRLKAWEKLPIVHKRCEEDLAIQQALEAEKEKT